MADVSKTVSIIFDASDKTGDVVAGLKSGLGDVGAEAGKASGKIGEAGDQIDNLGKKGASVDSLVLAFKALATAVVVKEFVDANVEVEKFEKAMTVLTGSTKTAREEFEYVKGMAKLLGLELTSTADNYVSLTAATKGTALEGQATKDIFESVSTAMSTLGRSSEDTKGALTAISQMAGKGTVSMEELRGQLAEHMPGALQAMASGLGLSVKALTELVSTGALTADVAIPALNKGLRELFGDPAYVDGYKAAMNRLDTAMKEVFAEIGKSGAMEVLIKGVETATASVVGAAAGFKLLGEIIGAFAGALATGDFRGLGDAIEASMNKAANSTRGVRDALFDVNDKAKSLETTGAAAGDGLKKGLDSGGLSAKELEKASQEADKALKELGIDPNKLTKPVAEIVSAFENLAKNPALRGDQLLSGLLVTLDKIANGPAGAKELERVFQAVNTAYQAGKLNSDEFASATQALSTKQMGLWENLPKATEKVKDQADELKKSDEAAQKAKESAEKYALEMEKLASNERIKNIEARVSINVAQLEADTERVKAAFSSIDNTVNSTAQLVGDLFKLLSTTTDSLTKVDLKNQIELENRRRQDALDLQKKLTEAVISEMQARSRALDSGQALITINGAGLAPHLEAFMWEILKAVQTRVNRDGLGMLLGM